MIKFLTQFEGGYMSGHNKWANIKQRKGSQDAKRSNLFSKIVKEIIIAARQGGGNIDTNATLRTAVDKARDANMPKDNIEKAIKGARVKSRASFTKN